MLTPGEKLLIAAANGDREAAERAFKEGAKVDTHGTASETPLQWAARNNRLEMAKWLIDEKKADVNQRGQFEHMPLHDAAGQGHKEMVELLLDRGAIPDALARFPHSRPVNCALGRGHKEIERILDIATDRAHREQKAHAASVPKPNATHMDDARDRKTGSDLPDL